MSFISRIIWLAATVCAVVFAMAFATSNTAPLTLYLWPFAHSLTAPVWLIILGGTGGGAILGGCIVWMSFIAIRTRHWRLQQKYTKMEQRATAAEEKLLDPDHNDVSGKLRIKA